MELPAGAEIVLNVFEQKKYPWKRRARRHLVRTLPNLWRGIALNPYIQSKTGDRDQVDYERAHFFPDGNSELPDEFPTVHVHSVNDADAQTKLAAKAPDILCVYGTGKIYPPIFEQPPMGTLNAHGGLLPDYRGLDTNLWAAYEGKPDAMAVTIHQIDTDLDTGPIYLMQRIKPVTGLNLSNLRYHATLLSTQLFLDTITGILDGSLKASRQTGTGRYFGPMPTLLKRRANDRIKAWAAGA